MSTVVSGLRKTAHVYDVVVKPTKPLPVSLFVVAEVTDKELLSENVKCTYRQQQSYCDLYLYGNKTFQSTSL